MSDAEFLTELERWAYAGQIGGYAIGDPNCNAFVAIIPRVFDKGRLDRESTLALPAYGHIPAEDQSRLLEH